jgi:hypothetical protein
MLTLALVATAAAVVVFLLPPPLPPPPLLLVAFLDLRGLFLLRERLGRDAI